MKTYHTCEGPNEDSTMMVTTNLHTALHYLRYERQDKILWIDAICIDQSNKREVGDQIGQMRHIYGNAERVLIWLGQVSGILDVVFDSLMRLHKAATRYTDWRDQTRRVAIAVPIF